MDKPPLKPVSLDANLLGQFWTSAADVFIEIVKSQDPDVRQSIDRSISSGGDVEITAHNQADCDVNRGIRAAAGDFRRYGRCSETFHFRGDLDHYRLGTSLS